MECHVVDAGNTDTPCRRLISVASIIDLCCVDDTPALQEANLRVDIHPQIGGIGADVDDCALSVVKIKYMW